MIFKIIIGILLFALLVYQFCYVKKWYRPADIYLLWSCVLIGGALVLYPTYNWNAIGVFWWLGSCFLCSLFSNLGFKNPIVFSKERYATFVVNSKIKYKYVLIAFFLCAFAYSIRLLSLHGFSLFSIRRISDLYSINNYMQGYRYGNMDESEDLLQQIFLCFTYALPLCGGILICYNKNCKIWQKILCFVTLAPNFLISFLNNTKTGIIFACILFFAGYIIGNLLFYRKSPRFTAKLLKRLLLLLAIFLLLVFFIIKLRYNTNSERQTPLYVIGILRDYIFGGVINFDYFFTQIKSMDLTQSYSYLDNSNILTANTFFIHQYGYFLTLVLWSGIGWISGISYKNLLRGKKGIVNVLILIYSYMNAVYFFTYIPYRYLTLIIGTFILFPVFYYIFKNNTKNFTQNKFDLQRR